MVQTPAQGLSFRKELCRGSPPTKELEPLAAYRLVVDTGEWSGGDTLVGGKIILEWSQP
jgi:hypothetical protein